MLYDKKWDKEIETKQSPTHKILVQARKLIEKDGSWCHTYADGKGGICAIHALQRARSILNYHGEEEGPSYTALGKSIGLNFPDSGCEIGRWNDTHTHADVLAAFDRAIAATY